MHQLLKKEKSMNFATGQVISVINPAKTPKGATNLGYVIKETEGNVVVSLYGLKAPQEYIENFSPKDLVKATLPA